MLPHALAAALELACRANHALVFRVTCSGPRLQDSFQKSHEIWLCVCFVCVCDRQTGISPEERILDLLELFATRNPTLPCSRPVV